MKSVSVCGYQSTAHREALRLATWHKATAYQLRSLRTGKTFGHREMSP